MMTEIPGYIEQRIRRPIPTDSCVVPGSTPVVAFGNARTATVATLGLNPSRAEFLDRDGRELVGDVRRLATHRSLGLPDLSNAPQSAIVQVIQDCDTYFQRRPYRPWFTPLEKLLQHCNASYYDGTACHLDLIQWATDPTWSILNPAVQNRLMDMDSPFLRQQLSNEKIHLLLCNGRTVIEQAREALGVRVDECGKVVGPGDRIARLFIGNFHHVRIVGWNLNLQSGGATVQLRDKIGEYAATLAYS